MLHKTDHAEDLAVALIEVGLTVIGQIQFEEWITVIYQLTKA